MHRHLRIPVPPFSLLSGSSSALSWSHLVVLLRSQSQNIWRSYHDCAGESSSVAATISGIVAVDGYAFDSSSETTLDLLVDGVRVASAVPNIRCDDIPLTFAGAPANSAFHFDLDTTKYSNGQHVIQIKAIDKAGNEGVFPRRKGIFAN